MRWDVTEIAEFVGGEMDGRTIEVSDPAPSTISVPRLVGATPYGLFHSRPKAKQQARVTIDEYEQVGRNDAGHLRYIRRGG